MSRASVLTLAAAAFLTACAPVPCPVAPAPPAVPPAPSPLPATASTAAVDPPAGDVYLPKDRAGGSPFCFDPESKALRSFVKGYRHEDGDVFDATLLAADVRDLHVAMRRLYAGYPELMQDVSFDVERFFSDWEQTLRHGSPTITFGEGVLRYLVELRRHVRDNHLFVWGRAMKLVRRDDLMFSEYQARRRVEPFDVTQCTFGGVTPVPGTARIAKLLTRTGLSDVTTFSAQSSAPSIDVVCGGQTVRFERHVSRAKGADAHAPTYETRTVGDATVIVVRALDGSPNAQALLGQIAADYAKHKQKSVIVFDFRGNGGGNDGYIYSWVEKAKRGIWPLPHFDVSVTGAARACGEWNDLVADQITYDRVDSVEGKAERETFRAKTPLGDVLGAPVEAAPSVTSVTSNATSPYSGRIFALADAASASSGETSPDELRTALGATVVGERTGGFLEFGNVYPYAMPRTGVLWELGSKRNYYTEPRDGVGIPVDVYLDDDLVEAPVEALVPLLEKLPKNVGGKAAASR